MASRRLREEQHRRDRARRARLLGVAHAHRAHRAARAAELRRVVDAVDGHAAALVEKGEPARALRRQAELRALRVGEAREQLVEDVVVALT